MTTCLNPTCKDTLTLQTKMAQAKTEQKAATAAAPAEPEKVSKPVINPNDTFIEGIMRQKHIDHEASHSNLINQFLHLISSSMFLYCYAIFFNDYERAVYLGLTSLIIRQSGHYIFEPPCHDAEQAMLGFDTQNKVKIVIRQTLIRDFYKHAYPFKRVAIGVINI